MADTEDKLTAAGSQARAQYDSIVEMVARLRATDDNGLRPDADEARQAIEEGALSVQIRSGWYTPGTDKPAPEEFEILLCTGGPAVRIVGDLDHGEPSRPRLQCQDWFTPWTEAMAGVDDDVLMAYCQCFYFGE